MASDDADPFKALIEQSGNSFHIRVALALRAAGWAVMLSPYYVDNATDKAREVDLIAEKTWPVPSFTGAQGKRLRIQLVVECKYIPADSTTVVWFDKLDAASAERSIVERYPDLLRNTFAAQHHYYTGPMRGVAKLIQTRSTGSQDREPLYTALNQCLGALTQGGIPPVIEPDRNEQRLQVTLARYPVIVCNSFDRIRYVEISGDLSSLQPMHTRWLWEINYAWRNTAGVAVKQFHLIDVVTLGALQEFMAAIYNEVEAVRAVMGD